MKRVARLWVCLVLLGLLLRGGEPPTGVSGPTGPLDGAPEPPPRLKVTGAPSPPIVIGPADDHPLAEVDRDAGVSVQLGDGSLVWFFGDSALFDQRGALRSFVIGTAAWAAPAVPTVTLDSTTGTLTPFARPTADFPACPAEASTPGMWPASAVAVPTSFGDRVVVWMYNICLGADQASAGRGMSLGVWDYDRDDLPVGRAFQVDVRHQTIGVTIGEATFVDLDGWIYTIGCDRQLLPDGSSPGCRVGRTSPEDAAEPRRLDFRTDEGWGHDERRSVPIRDARGVPVAPPGPFSIGRDESSGALVMVYSELPSDSFVVRVASRVEGPWSDPVHVELPGCFERVGDRSMACYAANLQPAFSEPGRIGIGYYDQHVRARRGRGAFQVTTVPVEISSYRTAGSS